MKASGEHRRGRSMGSASPAAVVRSGEKDEDLALFHEMKRREKHNFLHPSPDDLDATLSSKFGGMGAPTKKPGTDLLTSESDKNDYDWLLTPPGTPLFPSLDQEAAALAVLSPALSNGSYSSASSASKSLKSSTYSPSESGKGSRGGNPSPRRQISTGSTTPNGISRSRSSPGTTPVVTRPSTPTSQGGTRPSTPTSKSSQTSGRSSTPNLKLTISHSSKSYSTATTPTGTRTSTPTPRSSTPPIRPSTPGGRSSTPTSKPSTPTMRRSLSGGRTNITSPSPTTTRGGPSPKRSTSSTSRGNSPSAKRITSVITSIAGMSSEVPPNLRTTMPERSSSTGKANGSSNYTNGEESAQNRRRPRSPSVARSFSSSSSQEQRTSSQTSRGSVISPYDDGLEVNRPSSMGSNRNSAGGGKWHATGPEELMGQKSSAFAKRVAKSPSMSSKESSGYGVTPPRKPSDLVKRPVDAYQNSPTTAYRHLHSHSNSPVSPFYSTRANSLLMRAGVAMNSSMTTSSNASSEHGTTVAADTEGSERDEDDLLSWDSYGRRASMSPRLQQADILVLDKDDEKTVPWQDSIFDRAISREPSSSHSQGSQSTPDAEVTGFYETDGIASLEMLEQLGLMGENYPVKKSSSFKSRSAEKKRTSSLDDSYKATSLRPDEYNHTRISPHKVFQESQGSPARNLAHLEKQESLERPRRSRDFESKIPPHLIFQENVQASPTRQLANLEKQELSERPRKSRDFESKSSPRRTLLESQGSPARQHLAQVEKNDIYASPRKSRDFESRISPRRAGQGSPARHLGHLGPIEKVEVPAENPRKSRDFETELLKRNGEKPLGPLEQPQVHNSEIRAACLFVRDFKVGVSSPQNHLNSPLHHAQGTSPVLRKNSVEEMEMKLRNELQYDWDNSVETIEQKMMDSNGEMDRKLSDSPILGPLSNGKSVGGPEVLAAHQSVEFPFTPADAVYQMTMNPSPVTPEKSNHVGEPDPISDPPPLMLHKHMELDDPSISINSEPSSAVIDNSCVHDEVMDESEAESPMTKEVDMDSPIPPERTPSSVAGVQASLFTSHLLGIQSNHIDDGVYGTDEDTTEVHVPEDGAAIVSWGEAESGILEECLEGGEAHLMEEQHNSAMEVDETSVPLPESHGGGDALNERNLQAEVEHEAAPHEEDLDMLQSSEEDAARDVLYNVPSSGEENKQGGVEEEVDGMWYSEADKYQQDVVDSFLLAVPLSTNGSEVAAEKELLDGQDEHETSTAESDGLPISERQVEESVVYSNGNHLLPNSECAGALQKESVSDHEMESVLGNSADDTTLYACPESPQKLSGHAHELSAVDDNETSLWNDRYLRSDDIMGNQECAHPESHISTSVDHGQEDVLPSGAMLEEVDHGQEDVLPSDAMLEEVDHGQEDVLPSDAMLEEVDHGQEDVLPSGAMLEEVDHGQENVLPSGAMLEEIEDPVADSVDLPATQEIVSSNHVVQDESKSLEYVDADFVAPVDGINDEASSCFSINNHLKEEGSQSAKYSTSDPVKEELHDLSDAKEDVFSINNHLKEEGLQIAKYSTSDPVKEELHYLSDAKEDVFSVNNPLKEEGLQSAKYSTSDPVKEELRYLSDAKEDVFSINNHLKEEGLQSAKYSKSDSVKEELHYLSDAKEDVEFPAQEIPSLHLSEDEGEPKEDMEVFEEMPIESGDMEVFEEMPTESGAPLVEHKELPEFGIAEDEKMSSNSKSKSVRFIDKHPEVLDSYPASEEISAVVAQSPPRPEFRSASTLCAALEEQIAGLIQKIDSAIEESSKPFSASPQESLLVKDKCSILEPEQNDCTGSMRSSREEDLIDRLWAEDGSTSCSEESRDQDFLSSKDLSQREINGVRSSRLSDRFLPISLLSQLNDSYDPLSRSSRSDLGVEKRMLEVSSKRHVAVDQQDDVIVDNAHDREPMKSPFKSSLMWSKELNAQNFGVLEDAHFHFDAQPEMEKSCGEGKGPSNPDEDLRTASFGQEYGSSESSSCFDLEDMKTDAELLALCKAGEQGSGNSAMVAESSAALVSSKPEAGPVEIEAPHPKEAREEVDAASLVESTREAGEDSEASISHEEDMSNTISNGEARDQEAIQELAHNTDREELLSEETFSSPVPVIRHVTEANGMELDGKETHNVEEQEVRQEMLEDSPSSFPLDQEMQTEEARGISSHHFDHSSREADMECVQEPEGGEVIDQLRPSPVQKASLAQEDFGVGAVFEPESSSGREIEDEREEIIDIRGASDGAVEPTQLPESNSAVSVAQRIADLELKRQQGSPQSPQALGRSPSNKSQISPRLGSVRSRRFDESLAGVAPVVQELRVLQGSPASSPGAMSNGSGEESLTPKKLNQRYKDSWTGQHISLISPSKISRAERGSFKMEETDSGAERANNSIVRENGSTEAHLVDELEQQESRAHFKGEDIAEGPPNLGHQEVRRVSVWSDLPVVTLSSPRSSMRKPSFQKEETKPVDEDLEVGAANGNGEFGTREDKESRVGNESFKRLRSNKAKSVRTISLSPRGRTASSFEELSSPKGEVYTPTKTNALTNITVISPESLQWDHSSPGVETPSKAKNSPASLARNMTLAEATDTILYCSSLMHTIVYKAAAYAIEKEDLASLPSIPVSNGEVPHLSEIATREETDPEVGEAGNCKAQEQGQGMSTTGPTSVRRALSYLGHETQPSKPADTSLQIPVDQVIEKVKAPNTTTAQSPARVNPEEAMPVKTSKAKCGCTIM